MDNNNSYYLLHLVQFEGANLHYLIYKVTDSRKTWNKRNMS